MAALWRVTISEYKRKTRVLGHQVEAGGGISKSAEPLGKLRDPVQNENGGGVGRVCKNDEEF